MAAKNPQPRPSGKPAKSAGKPKPGNGLMGWLGRQVGHVKHAVQADVTKPAKPKKAASPQAQSAESAKAAPKANDEATAAEPDPPSIIVYRHDKIQEADMPDQPGVKLRRTIIDEVIVKKKEN